MRFIQRMAFALVATLAASPTALAWDPNAGTDPAVTSTYTSGGGNLPSYVVPQRYYTNPRVMTPPPAAAVVPAGSTPSYAAPVNYAAPRPAPAVIAPPAPAPAPVAVAPVPAYQSTTYAAQPAPVFVPAPVPVAMDTAPMSGTRSYNTDKPKNQHYIGVEGMYDEYKEEAVGLKSTTIYGGLNAGVTHYFDTTTYGVLEARLDYGSEDYKSQSGKINGIDDWEFEGRGLFGYDHHMAGSMSHFKTYSGLGVRYYVDKGKGENATDSNGVVSSGYDRRITQFYIPIGVTYEFQAAGLTMAPNIEYDQLLYGHVSSRLGTIPGYSNTVNEQEWDQGYGLRGEFAISKLDANGKGWEFTPFVRYWHFSNSDETYALAGIDNSNQQTVGAFVEPHNSRVQAGAKLKYLF